MNKDTESRRKSKAAAEEVYLLGISVGQVSDVDVCEIFWQ